MHILTHVKHGALTDQTPLSLLGEQASEEEVAAEGQHRVFSNLSFADTRAFQFPNETPM